MKHHDLSYIDSVLAKKQDIENIMDLLELACSQSANPETSNRAMANLCRQTYQNLEHILKVAEELKRKRERDNL